MYHLQRYHVAPGSFYVCQSAPLILKASLGTCVGVALYDQEKGIGGLMHLLLDKPPLHADSNHLEKYAISGLPVFWDALLKLGALPQNMSAWIAGGALVGPVEEYDLEFDIGGRTTDCVLAFLESKRISINQSETGGFFTCALNLNMQNWDCFIEPVGFETFASKERVQIPAMDDIKHSIQSLQPVPQVALKILRIIHKDNYDVAVLTAEIRKDQALCARAITLCNSALFAGNKKIESIDHALVYLGQKKLVKFVLSAAIKSFFNQAEMGYSLCKGGLYHHAVGTAIISEKLAEVTGNVAPSLAYTAGLLHDIGKVVLDQYIQGASPLFYRQVHEEGRDFAEAENAILGIDHCDIGGSVAQQWAFPDSLTEAIEHHHKPENAVQYKDLVHIVYLADLVMSRFHAGLEVERLNTERLSESLEALGFSMQSFADIVDMVPINVIESSPAMNMMDEE